MKHFRRRHSSSFRISNNDFESCAILGSVLVKLDSIIFDGFAVSPIRFRKVKTCNVTYEVSLADAFAAYY